MKLVLHIGLHRAASSSIQHLLQAEAESLRRKGVAVVTQLMAARPEHSAFKLLRGHMVKRHGLQRLLERANRRLDEMAAEGVRTVIFSDENMPGFMPGKRHAPFACAAAMANIIEGLTQHHDVKVLCVLREHVGYFRSIHNYRLMRTDCGGFETFVTGLDLSGFAFAHLIKLMSAATGAQNIRVAAFEAIGSTAGRNVTAALAELSGAPELQDCALVRANSARSRTVVEVMRALNGEGILLPEKSSRTQFFKALTVAGELGKRAPGADDRLFELVRSQATQHNFAITSERHLRTAMRLARGGLPMMVRRPDQQVFERALDTAARRPAAPSRSGEFANHLWHRFADDRAEIARNWLPGWHTLQPPQRD